MFWLLQLRNCFLDQIAHVTMFITSQQLNLDSRTPFVVTDSTHRHMGDLSQAQNVLGKPLSRLKIPKFFFFCFIPGQNKLLNLALQKFF